MAFHDPEPHRRYSDTDAQAPKRRKAEIPIYSFEKHQREEKTTPLYSPHVLILEGILAFSDPRIVEMLDVKACHVLLLGLS
jgi:uridine kinase